MDAKELYELSIKRPMDSMGKAFSIRNYKLIADTMANNEKFLCSFNAVIDGKSKDTYSFVLTDSRLILAKKEIVNSDVISWYKKDITNVNIKDKFGRNSEIIIESINKKLTIYIQPKQAKEVFKYIQEFHTSSSTPQTNTQESSNYNDLLVLHTMLEKNIITQEEFDLKKKELLNL